MANDLSLGDLNITISTSDGQPIAARFDLPDGSTVIRNFPSSGEKNMLLKLGLGVGIAMSPISVPVAPPYVEPEETPDTPPAGDPTAPEDTPTDPDTGEPEPGIDPDFAEPTRIELADSKQTVIRTASDPGTWGNAYVAASLAGYDYWEIHIQPSTPKDATMAVGVTNGDLPLNGIPGDVAGTVAYWSSGVVRNDGADTSGFATFGRNDKIMIARDSGTGRIWFGKNGTWLGSTPVVSGSGHQGTLTGDGPYFPFIGLYSADSKVTFKFISSKFAYSVPSGFYPIGKTTPTNTAVPIVTGTTTSGETLSCSTGTWIGSGTISYAYQWKADGVAISGATSSTYDLTDTEIDANITCTVTATNAAGSTSATSDAVGPVEAAVPVVVSVTSVKQNTDSTTITFNKPAGLSDGDLLVVCCGFGWSTTQAVTGPANWTRNESMTAFGTRGALFSRYVSNAASEPSTYEFTASVSKKAAGGIYRIQGADPVTPVADTAKNETNANTTSHIAPSVTPAVAGSLLLCVSIGGWGAGVTYTEPAALTPDFEESHASGGNDGLVISGAHMDLVGTSATATQTFTPSLAIQFAAVSMVISPA